MTTAVDEERKAKIALAQAVKRIREGVLAQAFSPNQAAEVDASRIGYIDGEPVQRLVITFRASGCAWARESGGCSVCGHYSGALFQNTPKADDIIAQFDEGLKRALVSRPKIVCLYNGGSFLNHDEIPAEALFSIFQRISKMESVSQVVVESRAEFCQAPLLAKLQKILGAKRLIVAVGLESKTPLVRNLVLHKGLTDEAFIKAAEAVKQEAALRLYLFLKPPFLTEQEAIREMIESVEFAAGFIPESVHIEPATLQKDTLLFHLAEAGMYSLPWLWSIREVLLATDDAPIYVSPFRHYPEPVTKPYNRCDSCNEYFLKAIIERYNPYFDRRALGGLACRCKNDWRQTLAESDPRPIPQRIQDALTRLEIEKGA